METQNEHEKVLPSIFEEEKLFIEIRKSSFLPCMPIF